MKKLFVDLEKEISISELEECLEDFERQTYTNCLSIFLCRTMSRQLGISCFHSFARGSVCDCDTCHICKVEGKYNREEILDYIKNGTTYSERGNRIMK